MTTPRKECRICALKKWLSSGFNTDALKLLELCNGTMARLFKTELGGMQPIRVSRHH